MSERLRQQPTAPQLFDAMAKRAEATVILARFTSEFLPLDRMELSDHAKRVVEAIGREAAGKEPGNPLANAYNTLVTDKPTVAVQVYESLVLGNSEMPENTIRGYLGLPPKEV